MAGWKSNATVTGAAVAGGLLSLWVHSFHQFHPTPHGLVAAYIVGATVCGIGAWCLLVAVGRVRLANATVDRILAEDEACRELTTIADVTGVLRPEAKP